MTQRYRYTFTVFTPTYNRAHTLHRVYSSLQAQTFRDFEWLIVDDGSTDETRELVARWQETSDFPIRYVWQENAGKHKAFNRGVQEARGQLFLTLDSDDACVPHALARFKFYWDSIPADRRESFSAVTCLCQDEHGELIGDRLPADVLDSNTLEIKYKYRIRGERWGFHRTDVLKRFPFDESSEMGSMPWGRIARHFKTRYVNEALRIYYQDDPDGSLSRANRPRNPLTGVLRHREVLNEEIDWFWHAPQEFLRSAIHYARFSFHCHIAVLKQLKQINNAPALLLALVSLPIGYFMYRRDLR